MVEEGDFVLCTVEKIVGTIVFVKIENEEKKCQKILQVSEMNKFQR